ncbi:MAG: AmmeMemoRadiSam system protein B [Patescibacteria group bacterium]
MLSFTAITPHPPIIIPTIGKENLIIVKKTIKALEKLEKKIAAVSPEIIIIISPHGPIFSDAFCFNAAEKYFGNFQQFGDLTTKMEFNGNLELIYKIREKTETALPTTMVSEPNLDHGVLVPLYYLTKNLQNFSIIPIGYSFLDFQKHLKFGEKIKEEIMLSNKKVAVIASGDLSHRLTFDAPAGYSPQGKIFDKKLIDLLKKKSVNQILKLDSNLIEEAGECGLRSILILLGIIKNFNYQPELLSYEGPFGVGYLVMNFKLT